MGNPWRCDCDLLPFREWLPTARVHVSGWQEFRCANASVSNHTFASFSNRSLDCTEHRPFTVFPWFIVILCLVFLGVVCTVSALYFFYVWPVRRTINELRRHRDGNARPVSNRLRLQAASGAESRLNLLDEVDIDEQQQPAPMPVVITAAGSARISSCSRLLHSFRLSKRTARLGYCDSQRSIRRMRCRH